MIERLLLASTTLLCLTVIGNSSGIATNADLLAHEPHGSNMSGEGDANKHNKVEIPAGQPVPTVDLVVHQDPMKGWNLEVKVANFKFAPERTSTKAIPGEGHAHLYINEKKITRLYGSWYYLDTLNPGQNEITVSLNTNSHQELVHNGQLIKDTEIIEIPTATNPTK